MVWLVAACLVPAFVMAALLLAYDYQRQRAELVRNTIAHARSLMQALDREFTGAEMSLRSLATSPSLAQRDFPAFHAQAKDLLSRHYANNIVLIDAGGQQRINTARPYGQPLPKVANVAQLERVLASGGTDISELFTGPVLQRPLINVAVPVYSGEAVAYSLVAVILPAHIQKLLTNYNFPRDRIGTVYDNSGAIVARTRDIDRWMGQPVGPELAQRLAQANEGSLETVSRDGIPVLTVFARSATSRWGVAIGIPIASLTQDLWRSLWLLIGLAALLLAGSLGLAWVMGGRVVHAVRQLRFAALSLGHGRPVAVPALAIREVDEVGQAITKASAMLAEASEALTGSEARMRGIVESATDAIVILDDNRNVALFNSAAVAMFGCPREQAVGTPFTRFIAGSQRADFSVRLAAYMAEGGLGRDAGAMELALAVRGSGEEFPVEISFPQVIEGGNKVHTLILRDITARLRTQQALERSNLDLQQFAYVASHDLKTPLRSIGGFVQLLEKNYASKLDERAVGLIRRTAAAAARLEQLTDDLLAYARVSSELRPFAPVDFSDVFEDVRQLLDAAIIASGASVTAGPLPTVMGDRTQLVQLLLNLVANGIKYCETPPVVRVGAEIKDGAWVFSVKDQGIGIDPKHHERIFEIFKRLHTQQEYAGTGIGLAICRRVVISHHGQIWITSTPGQGSTFYFTLPAFIEESHPHD